MHNFCGLRMEDVSQTCLGILKLTMSFAFEEAEKGDIEEMLVSHKAR
jgi:hypothetical protein